MAFKKIFFKYFKKQKTSVANQPLPPVFINTLLSQLSVFPTSASTPKSRIDLVYNFTNNVDITLSFAYFSKSRCFLSKGLTKLLGKNYVKLEEWDTLTNVQHHQNIKYLNIKGKIIFIVGAGSEQFKCFCQLLHEINHWALTNYSLTVGVDIFKVPTVTDFPCLETLSLVVDCVNLKFVFYNKGIRDIKYLMLPSAVSSFSSKCPLGLLPGNTKHEIYLNMMIELQNLIANTDDSNATIYRKILSRVEDNDTGALGKYKQTMNFYDNQLCKYLFPTDRIYGHGFSRENGGTFVNYDPVSMKFNTSERYILTTKDTELMLNGKLCSTLREIDISKCTMPTLQWIDGVPGCGKTTFIVNKHNPGKDLILTQTRAGVSDVRAAAAKRFGPEIEKRLNIDYRTVSSFIINGSDKTYERVFVDEALLMHAGYLGYITQLSGANTILLLGDSNQIPYIERSNLSCKWSNISLLAEPSRVLSVSKRCPVDVCYLLSNYYDKISTTNPVFRSISPTISDGSFHLIDEQTLILTFTQAEKKLMKETLSKNNTSIPKIHTIHEAQGLTSPKVLLVRIEQRPLEIFDSIPHLIVALSRHTEHFRYLTTNASDLTQRLIGKLSLVNDAQLMNWMKSSREEMETDEADTKYSESSLSLPNLFSLSLKSRLRKNNPTHGGAC